MRQEGPSVEEILQSIKRVMARDNEQLVERHDNADSVPDRPIDHTPEPASEDEAEDMLDAAGASPDVSSSQTATGYGEVNSATGADGDALASTDTVASMRRSLAALELLARPETRAAGQDAVSLDATVRDMLRPLLTEWLDAHLPDIVDRHVRAEIARITGNRG